MRIYRIVQTNIDLSEEALEYDNPDDFASAYSVRSNLKDYNIPINDNGTVTLYHSTSPNIAQKIEEEGIINGGSTATGGMTGLALEPSAFFGWNQDWVTNTWGKGNRGIVVVNVPYQYIRQPAKNQDEVYFEGGLKRVDKVNNIWEPIIKPRDTFYNRLPAKDYDFLNQEKTLRNIWEKAHRDNSWSPI